MKQRRKILFFLVVISFSIIFLTFASAFIVFTTYFSLNTNQSQTNTFQEYQYVEVNPSQEKVSKGFVRFPLSLGREEYFSFLNPQTGSSIIITNFGGTNYECTGSCYCLENRRSFSTQPLLGRGLMILISAFSVTMATKIAKKTFEDQCARNFEETGYCATENVVSEVENCDEEESSSPNLESTASEGHYLCKGYCLNVADVAKDIEKDWKPDDGRVRIAHEKIGLCESLQMEREVVLSVEDFYSSQDMTSTPEDQRRLAEKKYVMILHSYCRENSRIRPEWLSETDRKDVQLTLSKLEEALGDENNPLTKMVGKESLEAILRETRDQSVKGTPVCFGGRTDLRDVATKGLDGFGVAESENVKCVSLSDRNPTWEGWGPLAGFDEDMVVN